MLKTLTTAAAAASVAALALAAVTPASAAGNLKVHKQSVIYVESDFSTKSARVPIRLVSRRGGQPYWEFDQGGGHWDRCFQNCYEAYRKEVLDFWEEQTDDKGGDGGRT